MGVIYRSISGRPGQGPGLDNELAIQFTVLMGLSILTLARTSHCCEELWIVDTESTAAVEFTRSWRSHDDESAR
jgi:hypothetical protein